MGQNSQVKDRVMNAAAVVLQETGKLSQPQVAKAAGVPQGHLTYYFPRKVDLLEAVADRFVNDITKKIAEAVSALDWEAGRPDITAIRRLGAEFATNREQTRSLLGLLVEGEKHPRVVAGLQAGAENLRMLLAQAHGVPADDARLHFILSSVWGVAVQHLLFPLRADEQTCEQLAVLHAAVDSWFSV